MADAPIIPGPGDLADERGHFHPAPGGADPSGDPAPAGARIEPDNGQTSDVPAGGPEPVMDPDADANAPDPSRPIT
ncbi:MAG: hypothetical protein ACYC61_10100 [Isosphaeraceae bacterium]